MVALQTVRRHRGSFIVNQGSVGTAYDPYPPDDNSKGAPWAEFAVLEVEAVELRRVPFDIGAWIKIMRANGIPHAD